MAQPGLGGNGETIVYHTASGTQVPIAPKRAGTRWGHEPELGVHLHGPLMLAASDAASVALFAVYGYSWGLEIEIKAARKSWEVREMPYDPITDDGLRLGFGLSNEDVPLFDLNPGPHDETAMSWYLAGGSGGSRQPGFESSAHFKIEAKPYPPGGMLWVAWAWPELDIPQGEMSLIIPESVSPTRMLGT